MMIMHEPIGVLIFTSSGSYEFEKTEQYIVIFQLCVTIGDCDVAFVFLSHLVHKAHLM